MPGKFSPYYLAPVLPGVAALIGATTDTFLFADQTSRRFRSLMRWDVIVISVIAASLAATAAFVQGVDSWTVAASVVVAGVAVVALHGQRHFPRTKSASTSLFITRALDIVARASIVALVLGVPARWTIADLTHAQDPIAPDASLQAVAAPTFQLQTIARNDMQLLRYASLHHGASPLVLATSRINEGAQVVIQGMKPVPLGGFFGTDPYPRLATFTSWIDNGRLRWVAVPDLPPFRRLATVPPSIVAKPWGPWVRAHCTVTPATTWGGADPAAYWQRYRHGPLHSPLALYDCQHPTPRGTP